MNKSLVRQVFNECERVIPTALPGFKKSTFASGKSSLIFACPVADGRTAYISIQPSRYSDACYVEVAVSANGTFPDMVLPSFPPESDDAGTWRVRLSRFKRPTGLDSGYSIGQTDSTSANGMSSQKRDAGTDDPPTFAATVVTEIKKWLPRIQHGSFERSEI